MKILVTGGGTGGHIYPALSLVKYIKEKNPDAEILYVGTENGLESKIVPKENISFATIRIQGFRRSLSLDTFKTIYLFLKSIGSSKKIIRSFKPDVVLGTGGYVCGSVVYAASRLKIPTMIHEQNSVPGMTNKFLSKFVDKVGVCFHDAMDFFPKNKVVLTGNPRAQEVADIEKSDILETFDLNPHQPTVLIFGGSRGALKINQAFLEAVEELSKKNYQIIYVSGEIYYQSIQEKLKDKKIQMNNIAVKPYIENMEQVLANIQLVVGRAGATSLAEITALGIPSILVPSPNVTNDHQTKNALALVNKNAARMIKDEELTGISLVREIDAIIQDEYVLKQMAVNSKAEGIPDATERLYQVLMHLL